LKYKIIGLTTTALVLLAVTLVSLIMPEDNGKRYIEHIDNATKEQCTEHTNGELCTHLPVIKIDTKGVEIPGKPIHDIDGRPIGYTLAADGTNTIKAKFNVIDNNGKHNHIADNPTSTNEVLIRVRGHSSREFEKPNYFIRFVNPDGTNNSQEFLGMASHHEWALHGPYLDKSLIRNYMWYNIAGEIMWKSNYHGNFLISQTRLKCRYTMIIMTETTGLNISKLMRCMQV